MPFERIERCIFIIRGEKVVLAEDLAKLYGVTTRRRHEQVTRNAGRCPEDFSFRPSQKEFADLRSQSATSRWGGRRYPPRAFTEPGAGMVASILRALST